MSGGFLLEIIYSRILSRFQFWSQSSDPFGVSFIRCILQGHLIKVEKVQSIEH